MMFPLEMAEKRWNGLSLAKREELARVIALLDEDVVAHWRVDSLEQLQGNFSHLPSGFRGILISRIREKRFLLADGRIV